MHYSICATTSFALVMQPHPCMIVKLKLSCDGRTLAYQCRSSLREETAALSLAQVAFLGFIGQHAATGKTPLEALTSHISSPWANNFATNGVSLPF